MVLNLLYTRSLAEARAFLDRSFSRYLGSIGSQVCVCVCVCVLCVHMCIRLGRDVALFSRLLRGGCGVHVRCPASLVVTPCTAPPLQRRLEEAAKLEERAGGIMEEVARRAGVSADAEALWTT